MMSRGHRLQKKSGPNFRVLRPLCARSCPTLCDPTDRSPPGSSVHGVPQGRILEWVAISFSKGSSQPRDRTCASCCLLHWQADSLPLGIPPSNSRALTQPCRASALAGVSRARQRQAQAPELLWLLEFRERKPRRQARSYIKTFPTPLGCILWFKTRSTHSPAPPHALHWVNIRMLEIKKVIKIRRGVNPNAGLTAQTGVQTAPTYPERVSDAFLVHPLLQNWRRAFLFLSLSFAVTETSSFLF